MDGFDLVGIIDDPNYSWGKLALNMWSTLSIFANYIGSVEKAFNLVH